MARVRAPCREFLPLFPFAAALSLLACQNDGPVADNLVTPPEGVVGDQSATGLAKPGNAAAAEAVDRAALPPMTGGHGVALVRRWPGGALRPGRTPSRC